MAKKGPTPRYSCSLSPLFLIDTDLFLFYFIEQTHETQPDDLQQCIRKAVWEGWWVQHQIFLHLRIFSILRPDSFINRMLCRVSTDLHSGIGFSMVYFMTSGGWYKRRSLVSYLRESKCHTFSLMGNAPICIWSSIRSGVPAPIISLFTLQCFGFLSPDLLNNCILLLKVPG